MHNWFREWWWTAFNLVCEQHSSKRRSMAWFLWRIAFLSWCSDGKRWCLLLWTALIFALCGANDRHLKTIHISCNALFFWHSVWRKRIKVFHSCDRKCLQDAMQLKKGCIERWKCSYVIKVATLSLAHLCNSFDVIRVLGTKTRSQRWIVDFVTWKRRCRCWTCALARFSVSLAFLSTGAHIHHFWFICFGKLCKCF